MLVALTLMAISFGCVRIAVNLDPAEASKSPGLQVWLVVAAFFSLVESIAVMFRRQGVVTMMGLTSLAAHSLVKYLNW